MSIVGILDRAAQIAPNAIAVAHGPRELHTYAALKARAEAIAGFLKNQLKLPVGERVALLMKNVPEYVEVMFGIWKAGLVTVPMNAKLHPQEIAYILQHSGTAAAFVAADLAGALNEAARSAPTLKCIIDVASREYGDALKCEAVEGRWAALPEDLCWLFYTSGTTGRPKGAMITHRNILAMSASYFIDIDTIAPGDSILHAAPMSHGSGLYIFPHVLGLATQIIPESGGFDPLEILELTKVHQRLSLFAAPTMVHRLVNHPAIGDFDLSGLKTVIYGGAPMLVEDVKRALDVLGQRLAQLYGQGEAPMCITGLAKRFYADRSNPRWEALIGSAGFPQAVVDCAVMDADDRPLQPGEMGEICARGESVFAGYWQNEEASAAALRNGWLHTGDVGVMDKDGFLTLLDRSKDLIISGGSNIYPREVEEVLLKHKAVYEVSVVGRPHSEWGEEVFAFVVAKPGSTPTAAELDALCLNHIARFKRPKAYRFITELPKSSYGKVLKRDLREMLVTETSRDTAVD
jgi:long-chain acyl-CoA synthetase